MEFNQKLQELRNKKGLTQEELAQRLFVSRAAVSKWESNRGYPSIDSLKEISKFFEVSVDELLSGDELLSIAEADGRQKRNSLKDLLFGLLDLSAVIFLFLPFFGQNENGSINEVSLLMLLEIPCYLKIAYFIVVFLIITFGILTLSLQNCNKLFWKKSKAVASLILNAIGVILFIISSQPYAAVLLLVFLAIKTLILFKNK